MPPAEDTLAAGFAVRRSILGDAHVDRAVASTTPFTAAFQELITRYAWGTIWTRPGLDPRTRRLLVLAMMAATGRWEEFRLHVRTGLAQRLEPCDLEEVLLQVADLRGRAGREHGLSHRVRGTRQPPTTLTFTPDGMAGDRWIRCVAFLKSELSPCRC